jgi:glycosyltransferase 2 family protein
MTSPASMGSKLYKLARVLIGLALVAGLLHFVGLENVWERVRALPAGFVVLALLFYLGCQAVSTLRWRLLLSAVGVSVPYWRLFELYMIGMFANNFLPGAVGGDVVKAVGLYRDRHRGDVATASIIVERYLGVVGLAVIGVVAGTWASVEAAGDPIIVITTLGTAVATASMALALWWAPLTKAVRSAVDRILSGKPRFLIHSLLDAIRLYWDQKPALVSALLLAIAIQGAIAFYYYLTAQIVGAELPMLYLLSFLPFLTMISMLPISVGGLGVREAGMVFLFDRVGVPIADVLAVSLIVHALNTLLSMGGGALLVRRVHIGRRRRPPPPLVENPSAARSEP